MEVGHTQVGAQPLSMYVPLSGKMKGLAFITDPDGYWIEILNPNDMAKFE